MIHARASRLILAGVLAATFSLASVPARADVIEVSSQGAMWVTGDYAGTTFGLSVEPQETPEAPAELTLPDQSIALASSSRLAIPQAYSAKIAELSRRFDLSPSLLEAVVWQESRWRADAVSHAGARGLAQLMPATARYLGVDPDDPMDNLEGGARYLREQLDRFDGDLEKALAAYNAGPGRVMRAGGIPKIRETQNYVAAIMGRLADRSRPGSAR
ncbi:MAG: lytic transglycosylase domain-containing protein [Pseudomonadota bacterium]